MFSPTGKYLVVGAHISTYDTKTIITRSGKKLISFKTLANDFRWLNNKTIVYTSFHNVGPERPRGEAGGQGFGISKINVFGKNKILKKPGSTYEYRLFGLKGNKIQFIKYKVKSADDWKYNWKIKKSYFKMNKSGKGVKKTKMLVPWSQKIKKILPDKYKIYQIFDKGGLRQDTNWRLLILNKTYDVQNEKIYVLYYPQAETLLKVTNGSNPSWGWSLD